MIVFRIQCNESVLQWYGLDIALYNAGRWEKKVSHAL